MNKIKIFFADDSEYVEETSINNGSRHDVIVQIGDTLYNPAIYCIETLTQEFREAEFNNQIYEIDNALILVKEVNKKEVIRTILFLYKIKYFDGLKPINLEEEYKGSFGLFPNLRDLTGWKQVY